MSSSESIEIAKKLLSLQNYDPADCIAVETCHVINSSESPGPLLFSSGQNTSRLPLKMRQKNINKLNQRQERTTNGVLGGISESELVMSSAMPLAKKEPSASYEAKQECEIPLKIASSYNEGSDQELLQILNTYFSDQVIFTKNGGHPIKGKSIIFHHFSSTLQEYPDSYLEPKSSHMETPDTVVCSLLWKAMKLEGDVDDNAHNDYINEEPSSSSIASTDPKINKRNITVQKKVIKIVSEVTIKLRLAPRDRLGEYGDDDDDYYDDDCNDNTSVTSNETSSSVSSSRSSLKFCGDDLPQVAFGSTITDLNTKLNRNVVEFYLECQYSKDRS